MRGRSPCSGPAPLEWPGGESESAFVEIVMTDFRGKRPGKRSGGGAVSASGKPLAFETKIEGQMPKRGWSKQDVDGAVGNPSRTVRTRDVRHNLDGTRMDEPATAYYHPDGGYVVVNDRTGAVIQVSDRLDPNWRTPWDSPSK